mmetsp:Transcript_9918/g.9589  ORF Transcript_9918/g.9589 Transcript_9918/m.9589 type:complete len:282 (-) Transcript_9918:209-1054(-)
MIVFLATTPLFLLAVTVTGVSSSSDNAEQHQQCNGVPPQVDMVQYLGATLDYEMADRICCHNHRYAEPQGYLNQPQVALFEKLNPEEETIFYDVVCGLPLFIAPRGRSFADFQAESLHHGWPSFRPEEMISENVILHEDGRMESVCLTHLGHNLPESGVDRYCIDLVCIAGSPLTVSEGNLTKQFPSLLMVDGKEEEQNKEVSTESSEPDTASTSDTATTTTATTKGTTTTTKKFSRKKKSASFSKSNSIIRSFLKFRKTYAHINEKCDHHKRSSSTMIAE